VGNEWKLRTRTLTAGRVPLLMGVVNVTPDSFSDGGRFFEPAAAVEHGLRLAGEGADLLDIGGESTRPGAEPVSPGEELRRVMPVIDRLQGAGLPLSIDTSKAEVAREALAAGVEVINDITALAADPAMPSLAAASGCGVVAMHMLGNPRSMQQHPVYRDVVGEVLDFLRRRRDALLAAGIQQQRIALDPGIGFGKTTAHNLALLRTIGQFQALGCPLVLGVSRKRFIGQVLGDPAAERTFGTIGAALAAARQGVQVLRVHDVAAVRQALRLFEAAGGL
jgi:dihydropteroate synthase